MSHFDESGAHGDGVFCVDKTRAGFGFLYLRHDGVNYFGVDENGGIQWWSRVARFDWELRFVGEIEEASIAGAGFGFV